MKCAASVAATFALFSSVSAHMYLQSPKPIANNAIKNPLDPSGSDFPCHGTAPPGAGGAKMAVGSTQKLIFQNEDVKDKHDNTAVHGGGSCQVSIAYETDLAKLKDPNNWRVLYSIEGGCPTNSKGNLGDTFQGPNGPYYGAWQCDDTSTTNGVDCVNSFNFDIPADVKNGQATLAWTWFNTIGNREMYMNCVAVEITGGKDDASALQAYPPMFVANLASIGGGTCRTTEMTNVAFPNPGKNVLRKQAQPNMQVATTNYPLTTPAGCPSGNYGTGPIATGGSGSGGSSAPASSSQAPTTTVVAPAPSSTLQTTAAPAPSSNNNGGVTTTSIKKRPVATTTTTKSKKAKKPKATGGSGVVSLPMPSATASSCAAGSVPCIGVNSVVCVDDNHFGICDYNGCALSQAVAPGTMCSKGAITWAKKSKRHLAKHVHGIKHIS